MDSSRFNGGNSFTKGSKNYHPSYYQRPMQHPSQMMMSGETPGVPPSPHYQQDHQFSRPSAGDGVGVLRGRGRFAGGITRRWRYSRPDSYRNEEMVKGGRLAQYGGGDRNRFSRNYEEGSSVGGRPRPTINRLRGEPEETKSPIQPVKREERFKENAPGNRPQHRQARKDRPSVEDKENRPIRETIRGRRGGSQDKAQRRTSRDTSEFYKNNPNFIRVGAKKMNLYIFLMKQVFLETSHEVVEFSAIGKRAIMMALKIVETVTRVGYVTLTSIKTVTIKGRDEKGQVGKLKVLLKKTPQFDKLNAEFMAQISANPRPNKFAAIKKEQPPEVP
jgi:hypothetical protein